MVQMLTTKLYQMVDNVKIIMSLYIYSREIVFFQSVEIKEIIVSIIAFAIKSEALRNSFLKRDVFTPISSHCLCIFTNSAFNQEGFLAHTVKLSIFLGD